MIRRIILTGTASLYIIIHVRSESNLILKIRSLYHLPNMYLIFASGFQIAEQVVASLENLLLTMYVLRHLNESNALEIAIESHESERY